MQYQPKIQALVLRGLMNGCAMTVTPLIFGIKGLEKAGFFQDDQD